MPALNGSPIGIPTSSTKIIFGLETTFNTLAGVLHMLPVLTFDPDTPFDIVDDTGLRGSPVKTYASYQGVGHSALQFECNYHPEEFGYFMALIMGAVTTTGAGPFTHTLVADPASLSLSFEEQGIGGTTIPRYLGQRVGSVGLRFNGAQGLITGTVGTQGPIYAEATPSTAPADASTTPLFGYQGQVTINGSQSFEVLEAEINFNRDLLLHYPIQNLQSPGDVLLAPLEVTWRMTVRPTTGAQSLAWRNYFRNFTVQTLQFDFANSFPVAGATKSLTILMTKAEFGYGRRIDRGNIQAIGYAIEGKALGNATDGSASILSPCKITMKNAQTSYTT
jgi:hypothetical protein